MAVRFSTGLRNAMLGATGFSGALETGVIYIYTGNQPATADAAATGTLLGIVTKDGGAWSAGTATNGLEFAAAANGAVDKEPAHVWKFTGLATGTAGWFRFVGNAADAGGTSTTLPRLDGACGVGSGDLALSSLSIATGVPMTIDTFSLALSYN